MSITKKNILVIGAGSIGERHIRCLLQTGRAQVSLCERNPELLDTVTQCYSPIAGFTSLDEALQQDLDAALIATPAHTHIQIAIQCARRGLHLLIEKPLSLSADGVQEFLRTLEDHNTSAAVAYVWRAHPLMAELHRQLQSGRWGRPLQMVVQAGQHFPTFRPAYRDIYYSDRATGGGAILDALTHVLNYGEWFLGPITRVMADAGHLVLPGVDVEDTVHVVARHGSVMASYALNQHQNPNEVYLHLVCTKGTLRVETHTGTITSVESPCGEAEQQQVPLPSRDAMFITQAENFLDVLSGQSKPLCSLAEGLQTQRAVDHILASADDPPWRYVEPVSATPDAHGGNGRTICRTGHGAI